jgi:Flp pilus assembly protein TadD
MVAPEQPDVAREAGLAALELGDNKRAEALFRSAIQRSPSDAGLVANLALAQLLRGLVDEAHASASEAVARNPGDRVSRAVLTAVRKVREGGAPLPKSLAAVQRLAG